MDTNDPEFQKQLLETFKAEAEEQIQFLTNQLVELEKNFEAAATEENLEAIYRGAHSLKGAARAVGLDTIQNICQVFENVLSELRSHTLQPSKELFQLCFEVLDYIKVLVQAPEGKLESPGTYNELVQKLKSFCTDPNRKLQGSAEVPSEEPEKEKEPPVPADGQASEAQDTSSQPQLVPSENSKEEKSGEQKKDQSAPTSSDAQASSKDNASDQSQPPTEERHPEKLNDQAPPPEKPNQAPQQPSAVEPPRTSEKSSSEEKTKDEGQEEKPPPQDSSPTQADKLLKVSAVKLDALITQAEELLPVKIKYNQLHKKIQSICSTVKRDEKLEKHIQLIRSVLKNPSLTQGENLDRLTSYCEDMFVLLDQLFSTIRASIESVQKEIVDDKYVVENLINVLLENGRQLLMQPFSLLLSSFPRMVRDIALQLKKEIDFQVEGESVEIDRRILDDLKDPLIHLVRNCLDHGIESSEHREKAGKPKKGTVRLTVSQTSGNHVDVVLSDDGGGFPIEKLKNKAVSSGALTADQASTASKEEIIKLAFHSGVSSADIITEISGRGLGLGILAEKVENLGGTYDIDTEEGKGTSFHLSLPLTVASFRGIQVVTGDRTFIIPSQNIRRILRKGKYEITTVENQKVIFCDDKNYPLKFLGDLLGIQSQGDSNLVVLVASGPNELAVGVDQIRQEEEIFVKGLGKQLEHVPGIGAGTILEGNLVIPVLNIRDLILSARSGASSEAPASQQVDKKQPDKQKKMVLVAEDTSTTRLLIKNILENAGYSVITAADGAEALEILMTKSVQLLVTDIEMPKMTGFELVEKIHQEEKLKDLPIIIITAKETNEDKKKGIALGVNAYIEKSKFVQKELIDIAKKLI